MYVLIEEWIPGVPASLLGTTVEDIPVNGERIVEVDVCPIRQGIVARTNNMEPELRNKDPA